MTKESKFKTQDVNAVVLVPYFYICLKLNTSEN